VYHRIVCVVLCVVLGSTVALCPDAGAQETTPVPAAQQELTTAGGTGWGYQFQLGAWTGTVAGTNFAFDFLAEKYTKPAFSWGILGIMVPLSDLFEIAGAGVLRFHIYADKLDFVPTVGAGVVYADYKDQNSLSMYFPLGLEAGYTVSPDIALTGSLILGLHNLTFSEPLKDDSTSLAVMFGIRYSP
jgi:hypothetical protein